MTPAGDHAGRGDHRPVESPAYPAISRRRKTLYASVLLILLAGGAELVGQVLLAGRTRPKRYLAQAYYRNRDWSEEFLERQASLKLRYQPFVGWRRTDCRSPNLNVIDGERVTVHPTEPSPSAVNIWCFGGSTMWGEGVRDGFTIASHLARIAQEAGHDVRVRNLGESGWVFTQEALCFALHSRDGERPDIALFYDGVNDVFSAYQSGLTDGGPQNRDIFENYFKQGYDVRRRWRHKIALYRAAMKVVARFSDAWQPVVGREIDGARAAAEVAEKYFQTLDFVQRIGRAYDIETAFFWQPTIVFQPDFRTAECDAYKCGYTPSMEGMLDFYVLTTEQIRSHGGQGSTVMDLSRCLGPSPPEGYFVDHNHLNEEGNGIIARAIFEHLGPLLDQPRRTRAAADGGEQGPARSGGAL